MRTILYSTLVRLWGNETPHDKLVPSGSLAQNGTGTLEAFDDAALEYLVSLGVTHLWPIGIIRHATQTPLHSWADCPDQNPDIVKGQAGSPYAITDYYDIHPTIVRNPKKRRETFRSFVARCHRHGVKVVIDFVPNHVSRQYDGTHTPEGVASLGAKDDTSKAFDSGNNFYYLPGEELQLPNGSSSYREYPARVTGNDCWSAAPSANDWYETVKLNYGVEYRPDGSRVAHFDPIPATWYQMRDILCYWAGEGVDGFRCDMVEMVPVAFWHWVIPQVKKLFDVTFIAEIYRIDNYHLYLVEGGFDLLYDKSGLYDTLYQVITKERSVSAIEECLLANKEKYAPSQLLYFLENHDEVRLASPYFAQTAQRGITAMTLLALATSSPLLLYGGQEYGEQGVECEGYSGYDGRTTIFDYWSIPSLVARDFSNPIFQSYLRLMKWAQHSVVLRGAFHSIQEQARAWGGFNAERTYGYLRLLAPAEQQAGETIGIAVLSNFTADRQCYPLFLPSSEEQGELQRLLHVTLHTPDAAPRELLYAFQPWAPLIIELAPYSVQLVELR
ncbi:MAG: glycoside hydrolase family 13 [Porphyromonas sp.]|uniref:alpha-amylase family glycosyl hydrolase n=1 Tax=Porphyromonas sp. TaxID=1924944 RepID=UPI001A5B9527|nr:alpha-amylase family glycosyl hydrolase [Porphyromonas sp.]MBL6452998.1 glycoside hydrolase family 13 [Porphyromonas sp.]